MIIVTTITYHLKRSNCVTVKSGTAQRKKSGKIQHQTGIQAHVNKSPAEFLKLSSTFDDTQKLWLHTSLCRKRTSWLWLFEVNIKRKRFTWTKTRKTLSLHVHLPRNPDKTNEPTQQWKLELFCFDFSAFFSVGLVGEHNIFSWYYHALFAGYMELSWERRWKVVNFIKV